MKNAAFIGGAALAVLGVQGPSTITGNGNQAFVGANHALFMQSASDLPAGFTQEQASSAGTPITDTSSHQIFAAAGGTKQNYLKCLWVGGTNSTGTEIEILDGSTVIGDFYCPGTGGDIVPISLYLVGSANTAMNIKCVTGSTATVWTAIGYSG